MITLEVLLAINSFIGTVIAIIAIIYTYKVTKVRGPQFLIVEARTVDRKHTDPEKDLFYVNPLIQNVGDRMGFLRWEKVEIKARGQSFEKHTPAKPWEWQAQANEQTLKGFSFIIPREFDLTGGLFRAEGDHSSLQGEMVDEIYETPLTGQYLKPLPNSTSNP